MQTLEVEQTLLQAGFLHIHLEMGHVLHTQGQDKWPSLPCSPSVSACLLKTFNLIL